MTDSLSIKEAAKLASRSTDTIYRWRADGCNVSDRRALLEYSEIQDMRSRGAAAKLAFDRPTTAAISGASLPVESQKASQALAVLEELKAAFKKRLAKAQKIGDELEIGMLTEELNLLSESARMFGMVLEAYLVG